MIHGLLLIGHKVFQDFCKTRPTLTAALQTIPGTAFRIGLTGLSVCLCWVFFRAQTFTQAAQFFKGLVSSSGSTAMPMPVAGFFLSLGVLVLGHLFAQRGLWQKISERLPAPALGACYALSLSFALLMAPPAGKTFIYFQF
ncbi:MAG: hypothetical protein ACKO23_00020 [Gemmataceae bacterium]